MSRLSSTIGALAALTLLTGCTETTSGPETRLTASQTPLTAVVASARGSGHRVRTDRLLTFAFTAQSKADGSADGNYHVNFQSLGVKFDVDVTCMSVVGNRAWIAGIVRRVDGPIVEEGTVSYFYVTDNGEGDGVVDEISGVRINDVAGQDLVFCTERPTALPSVPIEIGNAQVSGG